MVWMIPAGGQGAPHRISRSVRFSAQASNWFWHQPVYTASRTKSTFSCWVRRLRLAYGGTTTDAIFTAFECNVGATVLSSQGLMFDTSERLEFWQYTNNVYIGRKVSTAKFTDSGAWMHVQAVWDSANSTAADRMRMYVNGQRIVSLDTSIDPTVASLGHWGHTVPHSIAGQQHNNYNGGAVVSVPHAALAEVYFVDGAALEPTAFGETDIRTGQWMPKKFTGPYPSMCSFYLDFSDPTSAYTVALDRSGLNNHWNTNINLVAGGISNASHVDSPTDYGTDTGIGGQVRGNYAFLDTNNMPAISEGVDLSAGGLEFQTKASPDAVWRSIASTMIIPSWPSWYFEVNITGITGAAGAQAFVGIWHQAYIPRPNYPGGASGSLGYYANNGQKFIDNANTSYGATYTSGDVIGVHINTNVITFYKNGVSQGPISIPWGGYIAVVLALYNSGNTIRANFGQKPFMYPGPAGAKCICTTNFDEPSVVRGDNGFDVHLRPGVAPSDAVISGKRFAPDLVWVKGRNTVSSHFLHDTTRGATKSLYLPSNQVEATDASALKAFNPDGYTIGSHANMNGAGYTFADWIWKKSSTYGFNILTWTGNSAVRTIPHGLPNTPYFHIIKNRTQIWDYAVYHAYVGPTQYMNLNTNQGPITASQVYNNAYPDATNITIGSSANVNGAGSFICYVFTEILGFSRFFIYYGSGNTNGQYVWCGFKPRFVLLKNISAVESWVLRDTRRDPYNPRLNSLYPNTPDADTVSSVHIDFLVNGFKVRNAVLNAAGNAYVFAAFAENPFKYARAG